MLADGEDEGVVEGDVCALGLGDVEVVALGVGGGVERYEGVRGVCAAVGDGETEGKRVRVQLVGVLLAVSENILQIE